MIKELNINQSWRLYGNLKIRWFYELGKFGFEFSFGVI